MNSHLVIAPVLLPLLAGIVLLLGRRLDIRVRRVLSVAAVVMQIGLAIVLLAAVAEGDILVYALGNWPAPYGIVLVSDRLSAWLLLITALLALFALLYASRGIDVSGRHFHVLFQLQLFGLAGAFLTGDLFNLFVFFEVLLIASYGLLLHGGGRLRTRAGLHYVVLNLAGSTLFLFAVGTLYGVLGTLNMADLARRVAATPAENVALVRAAGLMLFGVFALKAALMPLHLWLPAAYAHASAPVAALFAIMTKVGAYSILRVATLIFGAGAGPVADLITPWLLPLALATIAIGALGAVASRHLRGQVAYLVVASAGSLLTAFGLASAEGIAAGLYYLPHTTFATAAAFLLADAIAARRGELADRLDPGPTLPRNRVLGALFFVAAVAMVGLPPLSGFLGKFLLLRAALDHAWLPGVMTTVLAAGLVTLIALARSGSLLFYRTQSAVSGPAGSSLALAAELTPVVGLLLLVAALTVAAGWAAEYAQATASQLLKPHQYIHAVLGGG
ncbi:MAG: monovalent cation/H+ antiporter subunit D [Thiobacillaceae bacterium]